MQNNSSPTQLRIVYQAQPAQTVAVRDQAVGPLLEICLAQVHVQGVYVYRLNEEQAALELSVWRGLRPTAILRYQVHVDPKTSNWYLGMNANSVFEKGAWQDWRFQNLPEFLHNRFESALSIPVIEAGKPAGIANFCRLHTGGFNLQEIGFLTTLSLPLGSLLAGAATQDEKVRLETELEKVNRKLADRKLLDRAKGILQARFDWTEEEAYYRLRRTSRQSRTPMREIALHVIENSALPLAWGSNQQEPSFDA